MTQDSSFRRRPAAHRQFVELQLADARLFDRETTNGNPTDGDRSNRRRAEREYK